MFNAYLNDHALIALLAPRGERIPFPCAADRARWEAVSDAHRAQVLHAADARLGRGYPQLTATQFMAFVRDGSRQAYEKPYFERRTHLLVSALAECMTGEGRYMDDVIDGLFLICEETFWGISAHNGSHHLGMPPAAKRPLPDAENPYIDLFAAQTASTLSWVCHLLRDQLDAVAPVIVRRVRAELKRRIFDPFMMRDDFWWMGMIRKDMNNWTPWIISNVLDALRLWETDDVRLCEGVERALRMLDSYLAVMPEDGGCDEGAGYWNMAGGALLCCLEHVRELTGGRVDFFDVPHIRAILNFPLMAHIAGPYYLNFADCDAQPIIDGERVYRAGEYTNNAPLAALGAQLVAREASILPADTPETYRVLCKLFRPVAPCDAPCDAQDMRLPDLQVAAFVRGGLYAAIKGGHNAESHNHNDVGAFVLYTNGEPTIIDVGNMTYTARTFDERTRYTLFNTRSRNHNLPLIGETEQAAGACYAARDVSYLPDGMRLDIAAAYPQEAGVTRLLRTLTLCADALTVRDEISLSRAQPVTFVFMLRAKPEIAQGQVHFGAFTLTLPQGMHAQAEEIPVSDARMARNFPGSVYRLCVTAPEGTDFDAQFTFALRA